jgi:membrane protease YdiL (CAAX protease family)
MALSAYMPEISARSSGDQEAFAAYLQSIIGNINANIAALNLNNLNILINAAQTVILFIIFKLIYKRPLSEMGLSRRNGVKMLGLGCLAGAVAISLFALIASLSGMAEFSGLALQKASPADIGIAFVYFVSVGFYEEILCRGFFMTALKTTRKKWVIIAIPVLIFGLMHLLNPNVSLLADINIMLIGVAFAYMFIKSGALWMPVGYHIMWNFFQGNVYGIQVSGTTQASLMKYSALGPDILTGGVFGAEGGLICTAITLGVLVCIRFAVNTKEPPVWTMDSGLPFDSR